MKEDAEELVHRMQSGDEEAFDRLYELYAKKLYGIAYLISGSRSDSEDIMQEAFVTCFFKRESLREAAAFERWLYRILVRTSWQYLKRKRGRQTASLDAILEENSGLYAGGWVELDKETLEPLETVVRKEEKSRLRQAIQSLELKQRTVIVLYYFNDCSVKEIARITGTLEGTVKSRLFKGRENLRNCLEKEDAE
ncbi:MAG: sigma-70 family RNA polymerase sigma factor [Clostridium sp.]|nr:sigma-70 family RNA polymerase sigma factor [Clostridium sp.]